MKVVICGSHLMKDELERCYHYFKDVLPGVDNVIIKPFEDGSPLVTKMERYIANISTADLVVIIPKSFSPTIDIGEGTTYELAMARYFGRYKNENN